MAIKSGYDLVIRQAKMLVVASIAEVDIGIKDGKIVEIGDLSSAKSFAFLNAKGLHILPGVIDTQVHFREPGYEYKEDLSTGSAAAVLGGVTSYFEMPNTNPSTVSITNLQDKLSRAAKKSWANFAFYGGATVDNIHILPELEQVPGCCGIKVFIGSSTGNLLVSEDKLIKEILRVTKKRVAFHAEDEARLQERKYLVTKDSTAITHPIWRDVLTATIATSKILSFAKELNKAVHILHVTTKDEIAILGNYRNLATVEVTPQHLTLVAPDCYEQLGNYARMNPPIRDEIHQQGLWQGIKDGTVDMIGSDHAPHSLEEKKRPYAESPSGMPGVQTLLPLMLNHYNLGRLSLEKLVQLTSSNPARIFGIHNKGLIAKGYDADLVLVDLKKKWKIDKKWLASKCGWSPFEGMNLKGYPDTTIVGGNIVVQNGELIGNPAGKALAFL